MKLSNKKLRVHHYPQVPCEHFFVDVDNELEAFKIINILADQHLFLYNNNIIPDYANVLCVVMWDDNVDASGYEWVDYYNEEEQMDWDEFALNYFESQQNEKI